MHRGSSEWKRRQSAYIDALDAKIDNGLNNGLFGIVPPQLYELLRAGLEELPSPEREALVDKVYDAQAVLRDKCRDAAFKSGRARYVAPPNVDELLNYSAHTISINKEAN